MKQFYENYLKIQLSCSTEEDTDCTDYIEWVGVELDKEKAKVLDLGCGHGRFLGLLYFKGFKKSNLFGVDINEKKTSEIFWASVHNSDMHNLSHSEWVF